VPWNESDDLYLRHSINLIREWAECSTELAEAESYMTIIIEQAEVVMKFVRRGATPWHDNAPVDYIVAVAPELLASTPTEVSEILTGPQWLERATADEIVAASGVQPDEQNGIATVVRFCVLVATGHLSPPSTHMSDGES
jgi:hypothetical protein